MSMTGFELLSEGAISTAEKEEAIAMGKGKVNELDAVLSRFRSLTPSSPLKNAPKKVRVQRPKSANARAIVPSAPVDPLEQALQPVMTRHAELTKKSRVNSPVGWVDEEDLHHLKELDKRSGSMSPPLLVRALDSSKAVAVAEVPTRIATPVLFSPKAGSRIPAMKPISQDELIKKMIKMHVFFDSMLHNDDIWKNYLAHHPKNEENLLKLQLKINSYLPESQFESRAWNERKIFITAFNELPRDNGGAMVVFLKTRPRLQSLLMKNIVGLEKDFAIFNTMAPEKLQFKPIQKEGKENSSYLKP